MGSLRKQKPFSLSGGVSISTNGYQAINMADRRQPFTWAFSASPTVRIYGLSFPFQVFISSQTRQLGTPLSRYGANPSYKWAKLHLGWRTLNFGQFTLGGQQILGGGAELTPGKWRFGATTGVTNHPLQLSKSRQSAING